MYHYFYTLFFETPQQQYDRFVFLANLKAQKALRKQAIGSIKNGHTVYKAKGCRRTR